MLGIFAEFERSMIQERVKAGIKRVRNAHPGKLWGRRPMEIAQPDVVARIKTLRSDGRSMRAIADELKISSRTVWKVVSRDQAAMTELAAT
jgi:DNA invertase Pin-like site-specific DNA recombinase